ncbi:MAG: NAD-dependent epimerase/dehydratase family protein [Ruminococcus sp.]|nr:NAD-dependent epimerase/dehydratase family protein [Ruminococcus sp.]
MEFEVNNLLPPYLYNDILGVSKRLRLSPFDGKTVIITGAAGPLGIYLSCVLLINNDLNNANTKVIAVDTYDKIFARYGKLTYRGDIDFVVSRDYSYFGCNSADFIIHTQNSARLETFDAAVNLFNFIESSSASAVIAADADIYGDVFNGKDKIYEKDIYGYADFSKKENFGIQADRMVQSLAEKLARDNGADIKLAVLSEIYGAVTKRYFEIFKNVQDNRNVVADQSEKPESVIYIADAAAAVLTVLLNGKKGEIYNIASDDVLSSVILADKCSEYIYGGELKVIYKNKQTHISPIDANLRIFDNTKLKSIGFAPEFDLRNGIVSTLNIMSEKGGES